MRELNDANLVRLLDVCPTDVALYVVMELCDSDLLEHMRARPSPTNDNVDQEEEYQPMNSINLRLISLCCQK